MGSRRLGAMFGKKKERTTLKPASGHVAALPHVAPPTASTTSLPVARVGAEGAPDAADAGEELAREESLQVPRGVSRNLMKQLRKARVEEE